MDVQLLRDDETESPVGDRWDGWKIGLPRPLRVGLVGTYPPTRCGIATYGASLRSSLQADGRGVQVDVVRVLQDGDDETPVAPVVATLRTDDPCSLAEAGAVLSRYDVVVLQHEFGIYGSDDGAAVLDLVAAIDVPLMATLHTVTDRPTERSRQILGSLMRRSAATIVHTEVARDLLHRAYSLDGERIAVIPHGSGSFVPMRAAASDAGRGRRPLLLTWGLIGPGKGLEWAVQALALLEPEYPDIHYVIAGGTHPKVAALHGEAYRESVQDLVRDLGVDSNVTMVARYLSEAELRDLLSQASVVVVPYESTEQTSSGVLVEAATAGVPVVATAFPHAVEMEQVGAVRTVPHRDPSGLAEMIGRVLSGDGMVAEMLAAQQRFASASNWDRVGAGYRALLESAITEAS